MNLSMPLTSSLTEHELENALVVKEQVVHDLIVFNDDVNTFDHVIQTLIEICDHSPEQAEQCTILIHYKGKCTVKSGEVSELTPLRNAICHRGISAEVI